MGEPCFHVDLWVKGGPLEPRYTLAVVDQPKKKAKNGPFAVFIAPQGRYVRLVGVARESTCCYIEVFYRVSSW